MFANILLIILLILQVWAIERRKIKVTVNSNLARIALAYAGICIVLTTLDWLQFSLTDEARFHAVFGTSTLLGYVAGNLGVSSLTVLIYVLHGNILALEHTVDQDVAQASKQLRRPLIGINAGKFQHLLR